MKARLGFVSNSSSSSFMFVARADQLKEVLAECPQHVQHLFPSFKKSVMDGVEYATMCREENTEDMDWLDGFVGKLVDFSGKEVGEIVEGQEVDDYDLYDRLNCLAFPSEAVSFVAKKLKEKGHDYLRDSY